MGRTPDGMATMADERQNMREARAFEKSHKGDWKIVAHRPHPTTNHVIEETWGYYDSKKEATAAMAQKERPTQDVKLGVVKVE